LKNKIVEFVGRGDFGLASGRKPDGNYERLWFQELLAPDEVAFEAGVFLLRKIAAEALKSGAPTALPPEPQPGPGVAVSPQPISAPRPEPVPGAETTTIRLVGTVPPEVWNRLGTKILPKLRSGSDLKVGVDFSVTLKADSAPNGVAELQQILQELGLTSTVRSE
jgi:hypothetical protein